MPLGECTQQQNDGRYFKDKNSNEAKIQESLCKTTGDSRYARSSLSAEGADDANN